MTRMVRHSERSQSSKMRTLGPFKLALMLFCAALAVLPAAAQRERPALNITGYVIDAELDTTAHHLTATAVVSFTAPANLDVVNFGFHPALKVTKITDESGKLLEGERTADGSIRVTAAAPFVAGQTAHWTFVYDGTITGNEDGPIEGLKLAAIQEPISYLLYPARWFPTTGYHDRPLHRRDAHPRAPGHAGLSERRHGNAQVRHSLQRQARRRIGLQMDQAGISRHCHRRPFCRPVYRWPRQRQGLSHHQPSGLRPTSWPKPPQASTTSLPTTSACRKPRTSTSSNSPTTLCPPSYAPELAAIQGSRVGDKSGVRLLANTIAHQWWGCEISPHTLDDAWITNGMSRYGELMYVEDESGKGALRAALEDVAAGALAYDTIPLSSASRLDPFSPQFQSMTLEKGAMIFHMLRGEVGDKAFLSILKGALSQFTDGFHPHRGFRKGLRGAEPAAVAPLLFAVGRRYRGSQLHQQVRRLPARQQQGLPHHRRDQSGSRSLPHAGRARIETDGKTGNQKIDVVGTDTQYVVDTFGRPRRISIDPGDWVLKTTPDLQVRIAILKGQQLVAQGDLIDALAEYKKALDANPLSSLASYRIGEVLFTQRNYQAASTPSAILCAATTSRPGPRSGATSPSARSSISPASATAPSTSTVSPSRPTTTPRAQSTKPASTCKSPTSAPKTTRCRFFLELNQNGQLK